jgi:hypothetical protein
MWRQITRVEQPAKQIKLDNNEQLERKRTYDQVKRKSRTSWQKNRNWLVHNSRPNDIFSLHTICFFRFRQKGSLCDGVFQLQAGICDFP